MLFCFLLYFDTFNGRIIVLWSFSPCLIHLNVRCCKDFSLSAHCTFKSNLPQQREPSAFKPCSCDALCLLSSSKSLFTTFHSDFFFLEKHPMECNEVNLKESAGNWHTQRHTQREGEIWHSYILFTLLRPAARDFISDMHVFLIHIHFYPNSAISKGKPRETGSFNSNNSERIIHLKSRRALVRNPEVKVA